MCKDIRSANRRLLRLAYHLMAYVKPEIDMEDWAKYPAHRRRDEHNAENVLTNIVTGENGASACATIHACTIPMFNRMGLMLRVTLSTGSLDVAIDPVYTPRDTAVIPYQGKEAICHFFRLSDEEFDYLFKPTSYEMGAAPNKMNVARRIHAFTYSRK